MLSGSILRGYAYGADFSDACLQAMDNGFSLVWPDGKDPWRAEAAFGVACAVLLALAWTVVVLTQRWSRLTRLLAAPPALLTAAAGLITLVATGTSDALDSLFTWLLVAMSLLAVVAFFAIGQREGPGHRGMWRVALVLTASTAVGFFPSVADYAFMTTFSDASWDTPPGTGYPTVVAVALLALALLVLTLVREPAQLPDSREPVEAGV